ncbi:MAG: hypothetical protein B6I34_05300, partial [Anaerolineaceae bacterium 4572_32.1]
GLTAATPAPPPPEIITFESDKYTLSPGEQATLYYEVMNATQIYLNDVKFDTDENSAKDTGMPLVFYDDLTTGDNQFCLTASNGVDTEGKCLWIVKSIVVRITHNAPLELGNSGAVDYADCTSLSPQVYDHTDGATFVGETCFEAEYCEGFFSFDISDVSAGVALESATLSLGSYSPTGNPAHLGQLHIIDVQYGTLDVYDKGWGGPAFTSVVPTSPPTVIDVTSQVEGRLGQSRFQLRLTFTYPYADGVKDGIWLYDPTLEITYYE